MTPKTPKVAPHVSRKNKATTKVTFYLTNVLEKIASKTNFDLELPISIKISEAAGPLNKFREKLKHLPNFLNLHKSPF